jgi:hypothetical protein
MMSFRVSDEDVVSVLSIQRVVVVSPTSDHRRPPEEVPADQPTMTSSLLPPTASMGMCCRSHDRCRRSAKTLMTPRSGTGGSMISLVTSDENLPRRNSTLAGYRLGSAGRHYPACVERDGPAGLGKDRRSPRRGQSSQPHCQPQMSWRPGHRGPIGRPVALLGKYPS